MDACSRLRVGAKSMPPMPPMAPVAGTQKFFESSFCRSRRWRRHHLFHLVAEPHGVGLFLLVDVRCGGGAAHEALAGEGELDHLFRAVFHGTDDAEKLAGQAAGLIAAGFAGFAYWRGGRRIPPLVAPARRACQMAVSPASAFPPRTRAESTPAREGRPRQAAMAAS